MCGQCSGRGEPQSSMSVIQNVILQEHRGPERLSGIPPHFNISGVYCWTPSLADLLKQPLAICSQFCDLDLAQLGWLIPTGLLLWLNGFERSTVAGHGRRIHSCQAAEATSALLDGASQANVQHTQAHYIPFGSNLLMAEVRAQGRAWRWCRRSWHTVWKWQVRLRVCDKSQTNTADKPRLRSWQMAKFDIPC